MKPPTLTSPLARPIACTGVKVRARSKPTIEAGPPVAVVHAITTTIQCGAGPDHSRTAVHGDHHRHDDADDDPRAVEGQAADQPRQHQPADDRPRGHHHQQGAGRRLGPAEALHEEREAPQQGEDRHRELRGEVRPHAQPGAGVAPQGPHRQGERAQLDLDDLVAPVRRVLDERATATSRTTPRLETTAKARVQPSRSRSEGERRGRDDRAQLADLPGELGRPTVPAGPGTTPPPAGSR